MVWLIVCVDAFYIPRIGLAGDNYKLGDFYHSSIFETNGVDGVADPSEGC
jgi:hypothetical protein